VDSTPDLRISRIWFAKVPVPASLAGVRFFETQPSTVQHQTPSETAMSTTPYATPINSAANVNKSANSGQFERGTVKIFAKYPAHNNYFCSYEVTIEAEIFKPDAGRTAMIYFSADATLERSFFDNARFFFFLPKSIQPVFDEALTNKNLVLTAQISVDGNRPTKDQSEAVFRLQTREQIK
jgi:hypothetical protein